MHYSDFIMGKGVLGTVLHIVPHTLTRDKITVTQTLEWLIALIDKQRVEREDYYHLAIYEYTVE